MLTLNEGRRAQVSPANGFYLAAPVSSEVSRAPARGTRSRFGEWFRYRMLDWIDRVIFKEGSIGARTLGPFLRRLDRRSGLGHVLLRAERAVKEPLLGCQTCGFCRIPYTAYVCPETCPKGLANGPCGGTKDNWCEFGDRECIHNEIYRISKQAGLLSNLEDLLIPPVPETVWNSCSWVSHFQGGPKARRLL